MDEPLLAPEQWLEIGAMEIEEDDDETIEIGALDIDNMIPGQKEKIKQDTMLEIHMDWTANALERMQWMPIIQSKMICYAGKEDYTHRKKPGSESWCRNMIPKWQDISDEIEPWNC